MATSVAMLPVLLLQSPSPELCQLVLLLRGAAFAIRAIPEERLMDGFDSNEAFASFLDDACERIATDTFPWIGRRKLFFAFMPTSDWDDCTGDGPLGNQIFAVIDRLYGAWR